MQKTWNLLVCPGLLLLWQQSLTPSPLRVGQGWDNLNIYKTKRCLSCELGTGLHERTKSEMRSWASENCMVWLIPCQCMLIACRPRFGERSTHKGLGLWHLVLCPWEPGTNRQSPCHWDAERFVGRWRSLFTLMTPWCKVYYSIATRY